MIINGSPRKDKNTATLLRKAAEGAISAGADVDYEDLYDYDFAGCHSCFACKVSVEFVIKCARCWRLV